MDKIFDLELCSGKQERPEKGHKYKIKIDNEKYVVDKSEMTGAEILQVVDKTPTTCYSLFQIQRGCEIPKEIDNDEVVDFTTPGIERFITKKYQGEKTIFIDGEGYSTSEDMLTPNQIMELAGIDANAHYLTQVINGEQISYRDTPNEAVKICPNAVFVSIYNGSTPVALGGTYYG